MDSGVQFRVGQVHCFETKAGQISCDRDCPPWSGQEAERERGRGGGGQAAAPGQEMFFHGILAMTHCPN